MRRDAIFGAVVARNCLFAGALSDGAGHRPSAGNLSYCRVPPELAALPRPPGAADFPLVIDESCTTVAPDFFASGAELPAQPIEPDAAVLSPACPDAIALGADDGGELGGFHHGRLRPVIVEQPQTIAMPGSERTLSDLVFASKLTVSETASPAAGAAPSPPLSLERVAIRELEVNATSANDASGRQLPVLWARSSLFGTLHVTPGLARLEYCTVLVDAAFDHVQASDCVFAGTLSVGGELETEDCLRYSRLPSEVLARGSLGTGANFPACTAERPVFHESDFDRAVAGSAGLGVLHPAAPAEVCFGAEDGGEMGAFHEARVCLSREAVLDKLSEHLPVGVVPVLVPDLRLDIVPPVARDA